MAKPKVGVIGTGQVGQVLADGFVKHGYPVLRGSRDPSKLADWKARAGAKASIGTFESITMQAPFGSRTIMSGVRRRPSLVTDSFSA